MKDWKLYYYSYVIFYKYFIKAGKSYLPYYTTINVNHSIPTPAADFWLFEIRQKVGIQTDLLTIVEVIITHDWWKKSDSDSHHQIFSEPFSSSTDWQDYTKSYWDITLTAIVVKILLWETLFYFW